MVCWNYVPGYDKQKLGRRLAMGLSGVEAGLPDTYGRPAQELAGDWMLGADARAGILRTPSFVLGASARFDRFLQSSNDSFYAGGSFGALDEFDGENYGGDGPFVGAQAGYLWGRARRWGRAAVELQLSIPLFGERPNKPGNYVYRFASFGFRLFL